MHFLNRRGEDQKSIAKKLRCHPKTVQKWLKCATPPSVKPPRTRQLVQRRAAILRRRKLVKDLLATQQCVNRVRYTPKLRKARTKVETVRPYDSVRRLCRGLHQIHKISVSPGTILNDLRALGKRAYKKGKGPKLTEAQKKARCSFCSSEAANQRILFSDEAYVDTNETTNQWEWLDPHEPRTAIGLDQHPPKLLVWGCIGVGFRHLEVLINGGTLNADRYKKLVLTPARTFLAKQCAKGAMFQQDNARAHCNVDAFLRRHKIKPLTPPWPARSPDLSPIETIWAWLKYSVAARAPYGVEELAQFIRESWEAIPQQSIDDLVRGFKQRCKQCVKVKGNVVKLSAASHGGKKKL